VVLATDLASRPGEPAGEHVANLPYEAMTHRVDDSAGVHVAGRIQLPTGGVTAMATDHW
jgi:hypothetical protein